MMFTGLVEGTGRIQALKAVGGDVRIEIATPVGFCADVAEGDSISISGVCLTALAITSAGFAADVSQETLRLTSLGAQPVGALVNLEKALLPSTRMGGHFVSGHVDGLTQLIAISTEARSQRWQFQAPRALMRFIAVKGSVCLDGVSLTVNSVESDSFSVNLIPHTIAKTNFAQRKIGDQLNLEIDLIARYLARFSESAGL
jgi:riboflavin synthase